MRQFKVLNYNFFLTWQKNVSDMGLARFPSLIGSFLIPYSLQNDYMFF